MRYKILRDNDKFVIYKQVRDGDLYLAIDYIDAMGLIDLDFVIRRELDVYEVEHKTTPLPKFLKEIE